MCCESAVCVVTSEDLLSSVCQAHPREGDAEWLASQTRDKEFVGSSLALARNL
jgi:hypothetical protein